TAMAWSAPSVAEKLGIVALELLPTSAIPSRMHPPPLMPWYGLPRWTNAPLWWLNDWAQNRLEGAPLNDARAKLGLGPVAAFTRHLFIDTPAVNAADEALLRADPAWKGRYPYAGFSLPRRSVAPRSRARCMARGGRASRLHRLREHGGRPAGARGRRLHEVARTTGRRLLVAAGAAGLFADGAAPEGIFVVREAPHAKLFPRSRWRCTP